MGVVFLVCVGLPSILSGYEGDIGSPGLGSCSWNYAPKEGSKGRKDFACWREGESLNFVESPLHRRFSATTAIIWPGARWRSENSSALWRPEKRKKLRLDLTTVSL